MNVIQSSADLGVKLDAVRVVIHICVEEGKLTECGGLIDTACRQAHASQIEGEAKRMLPDFYLALLAGMLASCSWSFSVSQYIFLVCRDAGY